MTEKCITNKHQHRKLLELLNERRDIARGLAFKDKEDVNQFWMYVSVELNSLGPPAKDPSTWRRVWADFKYALKKKLLKRSRLNSEKGGSGMPYLKKFSYLEELALEITGIRQDNAAIKSYKANCEAVQENVSITDETISQNQFIQNDNDNEDIKYEILSIASENVNNNEDILAESAPRRKRKRCKERYSKDDELLHLVKNFVKKETKEYDEIDYLTKAWAIKLKKLPKTQRSLAEKAISDIIFEAEMGTLGHSDVT